MAACLFLCISVIRSSNQQSEHRFLIFGKQVMKGTVQRQSRQLMSRE